MTSIADRQALWSRPSGVVAISFDATVDARCESAALAGALRFIVEETSFAEPSELGEAMIRFALAPTRSPAATRATVTLRIPGVDPLVLTRTSSECAVVVEKKSFGAVDVLFETPACGVYLERVAAGQTLPAHVHQRIDESELVLDDGLLLQGVAVAAGMAHRWPRQFAHRYDNPTTRELAFLCIDRPSFIPSDETVVADAPLVAITARRYF